MKPFNLEEAINGKSVCTRDGSRARIICFDIISNNNDNNIVALVYDEHYKQEYINTYNNEGMNLS